MCSAGLAGRSVLIAEDEPLIAMDIRTALEELGAIVVTAGSLEAALKLARQTKLSAAIVDFHLGGHRCDGLCTELSQRGVPFMFYTGGEVHDSDAPLVKKPASMEAIIEVLQRLITSDDGGSDRTGGEAT